MRIKCYNPKCQHERDYNGKFTDDKDIITCTKCRYKLRLGKARIDEVPHKKGETTSQKTKGTSQKKSEVGVPHPSKYKKEIVKPQIEKVEEEYYLKDEHGKKYKPYEKNLGTIKILGPSLPPQIQKALDDKERNPFSNLPIEEPNFEIREIGFDPFKTLNHQRNFIR